MEGEIVISGISGRFPECQSLKEWEEKLFNSVDMITDDDRRWTPGLHGTPPRFGKIKILDKFDAGFFGIHSKSAKVTDPQLRLMLELTHEAIIDAGINPWTIRGSNTGVFVGQSFSEAMDMWTRVPQDVSSYVLVGCMKAMFANRISYSFDLKGPSIPMDTACSSSLVALEQAVSAIKLGHCDQAVVAGVNLCLNPNVSLAFQRLGVLSPDGKCKSFDSTADGYVRSEAAVVIFLQKIQKSPPQRVYARILNIRTNVDGFKEEGPTFPSGHMQKLLVQQTYDEVGVDPGQVSYVEAHGTGTKGGDAQELNAISQVFLKNKTKHCPLLIGSVKSNMGHSEAAAGLCSVAKVCLAMQKGEIPANLHFKNPNTNIPALLDGRIKVVTENTKWSGGIVGVSGFGFGGANVHCILQSNRTTNPPFLKYHSKLPLVIPYSGRTKEAVQFALTEKLSLTKLDTHMGFLLQEIASRNIPGHPIRGFALLSLESLTTCDIGPTQGSSPSIWFVYSGMGSQCDGIVQSLLDFDVTKESILKSAAILEQNDFNLSNLWKGSKKIDDGNVIVDSSVQIAIVQITLTQMLTSLGIVPSGIVGHSVGEIVAAFCDGCLTADQTISTILARGRAVLESRTVLGGMAAVGMTWEEAHSKCPPNIYPACHNSIDSVTVSGTKEGIKNFVAELSTQGIFAREVDSNGFAFHSPYIKDTVPLIKQYVDKILYSADTAKRTTRWIGTSNQDSSTPSSPTFTEFIVNNLTSPVLFHDAISRIPSSSIVVEIGPHAILSSILKRSLPSCTVVSLSNKNKLQIDSTPVQILKALGTLYVQGVNPQWSVLYNNAQFPVSSQTGSLSPLIQWDHSVSWDVPNFSDTVLSSNAQSNGTRGSLRVEVSLENPEYEFYRHHKIDERILLPATGYLTIVWKIFAQLKGYREPEEVAVKFENVNILRATILPTKGSVTLDVSLFESTGQFQILEGDSLVVTGIIQQVTSGEQQTNSKFVSPAMEKHRKGKDSTHKYLPLNAKDFYKKLNLRGYNYGPIFQGVLEAANDGTRGILKWENNWTAFLDTMVHFTVLHGHALQLPVYIEQMLINPQEFSKMTAQSPTKIDVEYQKLVNKVTCPGVELSGCRTIEAPRKTGDSTQSSLLLEEYIFTPYLKSPANFGIKKLNKNRIVQFFVHIVLENLDLTWGGENLIKLIEISSNHSKNILSTSIMEILHRQPSWEYQLNLISTGNTVDLKIPSKLVKSNFNHVTLDDRTQVESVLPTLNSNLLIVDDLSLIQSGVNYLADSQFLLYHGPSSSIAEQNLKNLTLIAHKDVQEDNTEFYLWRKQVARSFERIFVHIDEESDHKYGYKWLEQLKEEIKKIETIPHRNEGSQKRICLVSKRESSGIVGFINCLRLEPGGNMVRCLLVKSNEVDQNFNFEEKLLDILDRDLVMNVEINGHYGSYCHYQLSQSTDDGDLDLDMEVDRAYLQLANRGDLSTSKWIQAPPPSSKENMCEIFYQPLRKGDRDHANSLSRTGKSHLIEFSGLNSEGHRIMGCSKTSLGLSTSTEIYKNLTWKIPSNWNLAEASTIPLAYTQAYLALLVQGHLTKDDSILIHSNGFSYGVLSALISIASNIPCSMLFVTVESEFEANLLRKYWPELNFVQSESFAEQIFEQTRGEGVSVIVVDQVERPKLNNGNVVADSVKCLKEYGQLIRIPGNNNRDSNNSGNFEQSTGYKKNVTLHTMSLAAMFDSGSSSTEKRREIWKLVQEGIESKVVTPLPFKLFSRDQIGNAFEFLEANKSSEIQLDKVVIEIRPILLETQKSCVLIRAQPQVYFYPQKTYIIIGGLGGFGLELANWMVLKGARHLVLASRSGVTNGYQSLYLSQWHSLGVIVTTPQNDVTTMQGAKDLVENTLRIGPLGGIFNLAMVLDIDLLDKQTPQRFDSVIRPKMETTLHLSNLSKNMSLHLDHFVVFSSTASGRGIAGQTNYGMANSAIERICEERQKEGLPGLAIQWGAVGDVGVVAEKFGGNEVVIAGTKPQSIQSCLHTLENFLLTSNSPILSSACVANSKSDVNKTNENAGKDEKQTVGLPEKVADILGMSRNEISKVKSDLSSLGMDSLMGAEVRQLLEREHGIQMTFEDIRKLTFAKLTGIQKPIPSPVAIPKPFSVTTTPSAAASQTIATASPVRPLANGKPACMLAPSLVKDSEKVRPDVIPREELINSSRNGKIVPKEIENTEKFKNIENLENPAKFSFKSSLHCAYIYTLGILSIVALLICLILSWPLRWGMRFYLKWLYGDTVKLMERPLDGIYFHKNHTANMVLTFSCQGNLDRGKLFGNFEKNILDKVVRQFDEDGSVQEIRPYASLRWKWSTKNVLFNTWALEKNLDVQKHFTFQTVPPSVPLEYAAERVAEFYSLYKFDESKPQWEIRILSHPSDNSQFILVFVLHHSYGDGKSLTQMIDSGFYDSNPQNLNFPTTLTSIPTEINQDLPKDSPLTTLILYQKKIKSVLKLVFKYSLLFPHTFAMGVVRLYYAIQVCPPYRSDGHTPRSVTTFEVDLKRFRSVKLRREDQNGSDQYKVASLTPVILTCISRACGRISDVPAKRSYEKLIYVIPYVFKSRPSIELKNDFEAAWIITPVRGGRIQKSLKLIQKNVDGGTEQDRLDVVWLYTVGLSLVAKPFLKIGQDLTPTFAVLFSNMVLSRPSAGMTVLGGYRVKKLVAHPPKGLGCTGCIGALVDGDKVQFSVLMDQIVTQDCPRFMEQFQGFFEEELEKLAKWD